MFLLLRIGEDLKREARIAEFQRKRREEKTKKVPSLFLLKCTCLGRKNLKIKTTRTVSRGVNRNSVHYKNPYQLPILGNTEVFGV